MEAMDWSNLHTLHLGWPSKATLDRLRGSALPTLRHLSINAASGWAATQDEILSFVTNGTTNLLHSLSLQNMGAESGDKLIQTLTSLPNLTQELRYFSYGAGGENIFFLEQSKLSLLLAKSPILEHLDLSVPRDFNLSPNICGPRIEGESGNNYTRKRRRSAEDRTYELYKSITYRAVLPSKNLSRMRTVLHALLNPLRGNYPGECAFFSK
jgi:hypothetical protein